MNPSRKILSCLIVCMIASIPHTTRSQDIVPCDAIDHDLAQMLLDTNKTGGFVEDYDPDANGLACDHDSPSSTDGVAPFHESTAPLPSPSCSIPRGNPGRTGEQPGSGSLSLPNLSWSQTLDSRSSSGPIISGEIVLVKGGDALHAYSRWSGQEIWQYPVKGSENDMPVVQGTTVFVSSSYYGDGSISALDLETGSEIWKFQGEGDTAPASMPLFAYGLVYHMTVEWGTNDPDTFIYALDPATGDLRWRYEANGLGGQPLAAGDGMIYFQGEDYDYIAIEGITGEKQWEVNGPVDAAPVFADGRVILAGKDGTVMVVEARDGSLIWSKDVYEGRSGLGHSGIQYAAVNQGAIYIITDQGELAALDFGTGRELWRIATNVQLAGSPSIAGNVIYVGSQGGYLDGVGASEAASILAFSNDGQELWRLALNPSQESWDVVIDVHEPIAIIDGEILLVGHANNYGTVIYSLSSN